MRLSRYFHELQDGYLAEIEDLRLDSEGRDVLQRRLRDKRDGFAAIVPMIDTDPLMLAPALHGAFRLPPGRVPAIEDLLLREPDELPSWGELGRDLELEAWARPLVERVLAEEAGSVFLATVVGLEYLLARQRGDGAASAGPEAADGGSDGRDGRDGDDGDDGGRDGDDDGFGDLGDRAEDFLEQQGFDRRSEP
jgi:hypothetical protein